MAIAAKVSVSVLLAATLVCASRADAQTTPSSEKENTDKAREVVITGRRPDVVDKIDRRTYDIRNDPQSKTGFILDLLKKIPSVTVSPDGSVELRGDSGVIVMIDGKRPPNGNSALRSLPSAGVDKIEVITNPSAQYAPDGMGIINIITDKKRILGFSGNASMGSDAFGNGSAAVSVALTQGHWTFSGGLNGSHIGRPYHGEDHQEALNSFTLGVDSLDQDSRGRIAGGEFSSNVMAAYKVSDKASLTIAGFQGNGSNRKETLTQYNAATGNFSEATSSHQSHGHAGLNANYLYSDDANAEKLTLNASLNTKHNRETAQQSETLTGGGSSSVYQDANGTNGASNGLSAEYERSYDKRILVAGVSVGRETTDAQSDYKNLSGVAGPQSFDSSYALKGTRTISALYATYQMPVGKWAVLPGLRLEEQQLQLPNNLSRQSASLYPSIHFSRDLGPTTRLKFSYSKRIRRPGIDMYDPTVEYSDVRSASSGNPDLKPTYTDSYEASYDVTGKALSYGTTIYYRVNQGEFSAFSQLLPSGVLLNTTVNAGQSSAGGAEFTMRGSLSPKIKYNLNTDIFYSEIGSSEGTGGRRGGTTSFGNANIEYDGVKRGNLNGDQYQLSAYWRGKKQTLQGYVGSSYEVDTVYSHALNSKLSIVASVLDIFSSNIWRQYTDTPALKVQSIVHPQGTIVRIDLAYKFGPNK